MRTVFQQARHCLITFNSIDIFQNLYFSIALASGCVPIVAGHDHILPYENLIDWSLAVDRIGVQEIFFLDHFLTPGSDLRKKRHQGLYLFQQYFSSIDKVCIFSSYNLFWIYRQGCRIFFSLYARSVAHQEPRIWILEWSYRDFSTSFERFYKTSTRRIHCCHFDIRQIRLYD